MTPTQPRSLGRRAAGMLFKVLVVAALLGWLAHKGVLSIGDTARAYQEHPWLILGAQSLAVLTALLGGLRWWWLLRAQDVDLPLGRTLQLSLIGNFFNIALPGAISGDLMKAYYTGNDVEGRRARVFGTIFFDRVLGISALALVCATAQALVGREFIGNAVMVDALRVFAALMAAGVVGFYAYLFLVPQDKDILMRILDAAAVKVPAVLALREFYLGMRHYHTRKVAVLQGLALSVVLHLIVGVVCTGLAWGLGETQLSLTQVYASAPLAFLVTTVPVAPAGVGTGHAAFAFLFELIGSKRGADVFTLFALAQFFTGGLGGLVYLRFKAREPLRAVAAA